MRTTLLTAWPAAALLALFSTPGYYPAQPPGGGKPQPPKPPPDEFRSLVREVEEAYKAPFEVDQDVVRKYREFAQSRRAFAIAGSLLKSLREGGRVFFTGCGSTGRLSIQLVSIWRDFWLQQAARGVPSAADLEHRAFAVMAGGDYALINAVE